MIPRIDMEANGTSLGCVLQVPVIVHTGSLDVTVMSMAYREMEI